MTDAASIARNAAARLAATLGPDLLVNVASLARTIWHDVRKDRESRPSLMACGHHQGK